MASTSTDGVTPHIVAETLDRYGGLVREALREILDQGEPRRHLYDLAADYPARGGRMLRSSLCIATACAFGGKVEDALNTALSLELMHNGFLIHDDVEDEGEQRRGRPTLHALHGVPLAVNVGDALVVMSLRPLISNVSRLGPRLAFRVLEETERMARESVEGQAIELGWRRDNALDVEDDDYLEMILKKTCWYTTIYPSRVGALIATRDGVDLERFVRFGFFLGAAFQIQDDLLNLIGDEAKYGKELNGDLREGKRTLMLLHVLRAATVEERQRLVELLRGPRAGRGDAEVAWIRERMDHYGSIEYGRELAHGLAGAALHESQALYGGLPESRDKEFILNLATWMLERS
jgi:geranylgeranyl diphosphate synthase type II